LVILVNDEGLTCGDILGSFHLPFALDLMVLFKSATVIGRAHGICPLTSSVNIGGLVGKHFLSEPAEI
jgi:hypothetical protein